MSSTPTEVFAVLREAATRVLGGDRCVILSVPDTHAATHELGELPHALAAEAVAAGDVVTHSGSLAEGRVALCAPVRVGESVTACVYVDRLALDRPFGQDERAVAGQLTTLAEVAFERPDGLTALEALGRTLERRIEERTRDLRHLALHDPLTGLANRGLFADRVEHALARAARDGARVGVLFIDLDDFKAVNDSLGHAAGDELLVTVAERLRSSLRESDTPARLGGDEFAILLEGVRRVDDAECIAQRILAALEQPIRLGTDELRVYGSVGIAVGQPALDQRGGPELLREADAAMYLAKRAGNGRYATSGVPTRLPAAQLVSGGKGCGSAA